ncbi:MAG: permease [candidate division WOR-3 bacterium]
MFEKKDLKWVLWIITAFLLAYFVPWEHYVVLNALKESLLLLQDYARNHVLLCLVPAFFIAGAISVFVSNDAVLRYFGPMANKLLSYSVASVSGSVLAVCSCTVLPLFAGIYTRGAGIGPATAFLYSGPAINVLAIILTAKVLGLEMGLARAIGAVGFSVIVGLLMHLIFLKEERRKLADEGERVREAPSRPLWKNATLLVAMVGFLVLVNMGFLGWWRFAWGGTFLVLVVGLSIAWMNKDEALEWFGESWFYAKLILPLLLGGVLVAGFLLGRPGHPALVPENWVIALVGGNSIRANLFASVAGAFMYFATLTEVPILQGLMGSGMGKGPALSMLLAGPAVSLPSMLVLLRIMGWRKTGAYIGIVVILSTLAGWLYGSLL